MNDKSPLGFDSLVTTPVIQILSIHFIKKKMMEEAPEFMQSKTSHRYNEETKAILEFDHSKYIKSRDDLPLEISINGFLCWILSSSPFIIFDGYHKVLAEIPVELNQWIFEKYWFSGYILLKFGKYNIILITLIYPYSHLLSIFKELWFK